MIPEYFVKIVNWETGELDTQLGPYPTKRQAEKADDGVNSQLNHERYYTLVEDFKGLTDPALV